jgi:hypothetical protein
MMPIWTPLRWELPIVPGAIAVLIFWFFLLFVRGTHNEKTWQADWLQLIHETSFCVLFAAILLTATGCGGGGIAAPTAQASVPVLTPS